jgi:hypothetical protein
MHDIEFEKDDLPYPKVIMPTIESLLRFHLSTTLLWRGFAQRRVAKKAFFAFLDESTYDMCL